MAQKPKVHPGILPFTGMSTLQPDSSSQPRQHIRVTWEPLRYPHAWATFSSIRADSQVGLNFKGPRKCGVFSKVL